MIVLNRTTSAYQGLQDAVYGTATVDRPLPFLVQLDRHAGAELLGPTHVDMWVRIAETLSAEITIRLTHSGEKIFAGTGRNAGLEVCGDIPRLLTLAGGVMK